MTERCPHRARTTPREPVVGFISRSARLEVRQHCEHPSVIVTGLGNVELHENAVHMFLDRALGDEELACDARIRSALSHQREDLTLARREHVERVAYTTGGHELLHKGGIDHRAAFDDPL